MDTAFLVSGLSGAAALFMSLKLKILDEKVEVLSGYPANCNTWLTIYHYRKSDRWSFEWYGKDGCTRPALLGDMSACLMREITEKDVSKMEHAHARILLESNGFFDA